MFFQQTAPQENSAQNKKQEKQWCRWNLKQKMNCWFTVIEIFVASAFNQCLLKRTYPANWKIAEVIPLPKKDDESNPKIEATIQFIELNGRNCRKVLKKNDEILP